MGSAPLSGELQIVLIVSGLVLLAWVFYIVVNMWRRGSAIKDASESLVPVKGRRKPSASDLPTVEEKNDAERSVRRMIDSTEPVASVPLTGVMELEKAKVRIPSA